MVNRDYANQLLTKVEGNLKKLKFAVQRQEPLEVFKNTLKDTEEIVENLKSVLDREPLSPNEINRR